MYYNRFRYYAPNEGGYISQDPIGLNGGIKLYSYVIDTNTWLDIFGWHGHDLGNIADSQLYHIEINGQTFKYGIATEKFVTKTDISVIAPNGDVKIIPAGTPTRLKDQLRKAYSNYDDVKVTTTKHSQISTQDMKALEDAKIEAHVKTHGKVPAGNIGHKHLGPVDNYLNGVHDLKKDLKMQKNKPKHH